MEYTTRIQNPAAVQGNNVPDLLNCLLSKQITLKQYEQLRGLPPKETDPDLIYECEQDAEYFSEFERGEL